MTDIPAPLVPAGVDLRGMEWMPLYGHRLFGSDFDAHASDTEWRAGVTLWWAAWNQIPAASLPNDDVALCRLAGLGRDKKSWARVKIRALHGFVHCSDGRLYHRALAKLAAEAWDKRLRNRERKSKWRRGQDADAAVTERGPDAGRNDPGTDEKKRQDRINERKNPPQRSIETSIPPASAELPAPKTPPNRPKADAGAALRCLTEIQNIFGNPPHAAIWHAGPIQASMAEGATADDWQHAAKVAMAKRREAPRSLAFLAPIVADLKAARERGLPPPSLNGRGPAASRNPHDESYLVDRILREAGDTP